MLKKLTDAHKALLGATFQNEIANEAFLEGWDSALAMAESLIESAGEGVINSAVMKILETLRNG